MNIALIKDDSKYDSISVEECKIYNPGLGGGTYQFINLYNILSSNEYNNVYFFHKNKTNFNDIPSDYNILYENNEELFYILSKLSLDGIILPQRFGYDLLDRFEMLSVPITYRCGNYINATEVNYLRNSTIKYVVCLNWEQASKCYDTKIYNKVVIIPNYINFGILEINSFRNNKARNPEKFVITYMGSISPSKGLHLLAKVWHKIVKKIPNAELNIIGSDTLYGQIFESSTPNNISSYEKRVRSIFDKNPFSADKVVYHGKLGVDKYKIIKNSNIGIVNPSGLSEVFTNSVVDFSLFDIPVLGRNKFGLVSMIEDGLNGYKFNSLKGLVNKIIFIHNNNLDFNGLDFLMDKFTGRNVVYNWLILFDDSKSQDFLFPTRKISLKMLFHNFFFLRIIFRKTQDIAPFWPSVIEIEFFLKYSYRRLKSLFKFLLISLTFTLY